MTPFTEVTALVASLDRINVDTDQIIPKQFLKRIERTGFGRYLFNDWRFREDGTLDPDFELNLPRFKGAAILVARANFGCGSSREHAPWALLDYGFRSILAPSFADIFYNNCFKNGILPVCLDPGQIEEIFRRVQSHGYRMTVDLRSRQVRDEAGLCYSFDIDPFRRQSLLEGLDDIGLSLQMEEKIQAFEEAR